MKKIPQSINKKPNWLKTKINVGSNYKELKTMVKTKNLNTVCEEALCPNIYECWERRSATLMILGDVVFAVLLQVSQFGMILKNH